MSASAGGPGVARGRVAAALAEHRGKPIEHLDPAAAHPTSQFRLRLVGYVELAGCGDGSMRAADTEHGTAGSVAPAAPASPQNSTGPGTPPLAHYGGVFLWASRWGVEQLEQGARFRSWGLTSR